MKITLERIDNLLKGYRDERPTLLFLLQQELSKEAPSKTTAEKLDEELSLYSVLEESVMKLNSHDRPIVLFYYFSEQRVSIPDTAAYFDVDRSTVSRVLAKAKKSLVAIMNRGERT
ncbi:hypothetical protein [Anaerotruncus rubiinfantis]|uniref:hypothetical protein n=1 Tax=Anaerotruncus rubiinfantis TaxID=1720200 RepID=UPI001898DA48|nr:hypothetical protein [Anaerotruncus rubiinfantis]